MIDQLFNEHYPLIIAALVVIAIAYKLNKKKKKRSDFWKGYKYIQDKGTSVAKNKFADAMNYIKNKNPALYRSIDMKLALVRINNRTSPHNSKAIMSAQKGGNTIDVWKPMWVLFSKRKDWCHTIIHEFGHLEGLSHGKELDRRTIARMKSIGY